MSIIDRFIKLGLSHVEDGYVYGTNGEILTEALLQNRIKLLDPNQTGSFRPSYVKHIRDNYMGKFVADCSGLIVYLCRQLNLDQQDYSANSLYLYQCDHKSFSAKERGDLIFKRNATSGKMYHVGIYLGNNEVLEAQGTMYGIRRNKLSSSWTHVGRLKVFGETEAEQEKSYAGYYEVEVSNYLNVRETPSGRILERLVPHDYAVGLGIPSVYQNGYTWVKVKCINLDAIGWVAEKYLKRIDKLPRFQ